VRYLGLDVGRATVGLALADDVLRTARALRTLRRAGDGPLFEVLRKVAEEYEVTQVVVGLPLHMDGTEGDSARLARGFARKLEDTLHLPVALHDERLSTFEAEGRLRAQGLRAREQRAVIDAEAAAVILQGWLDARAGEERRA
jgi:putative Holliday junction resolvase